jgi:CheY-like chemotaxis protein
MRGPKRVARNEVAQVWRRFIAGGPVHSMMQDNQQLTLGTESAVLLIDDNAIQAATRQAILKRAGYYVIAALNPVRALEQLQDDAFPAPIHAVITDHIMPGMNGAQFVRELRKIQPGLPIMVISGLEEAEQEYAGMNVRFLLKPLSPDLLLANLRYLIEQEQEGAA